MDVILKFKIFIIFVLIAALIIVSILFYIIVDMHMISKETSKLASDNINLIDYNYNSITETINNIKNINKYINDPLLPNKISQVNKLKKYIDINNKEDLEKVSEIVNSTPLDLITSSIIVSYCNKLDIPLSLMLALIEHESNFKQYEVGKNFDRGYCQLIPETEKWLAQNYGYILDLKYDKNNIYNPEYNIGLGAIYLYILKNAYGDNYHKILSEYNRGVYNLKKYYDKHGTYVTSYSRSILTKERRYQHINE
ncbi:lytic transglycosylase domain-containing protein [Caldisalinibacter kiritimatiensis]|uniref:Transglycosylase SLT domain-containing protein n=1 Tax=Caldisalinibacter kiritimatiensis TaxID=1304284 RepID=R1CBB1_9FIRM|nr:lytic transglycosylase domain-containing protein [Caldisalinibacter kiritimatiensis]EOC99599.1 hypothetical protein L21TH_2372 [Caldisalinibacter kiritimatiensis]